VPAHAARPGGRAPSRALEVGSRRATALSLQRTVGNRALGQMAGERTLTASAGLLMRTQARTLFAALPEIAAGRGRWNPHLQWRVDRLSGEWGDLDFNYAIGRTPWVLAWLPSLTWIVVDPDRVPLVERFNQARVAAYTERGRWPPGDLGTDQHTKLLLHLLGVSDAPPPGWGTFGDMRFPAGGELEGRPGFATSTLLEVETTFGEDRRHITAWHNLRGLLNHVARLGDDGLALLAGALADPRIDDSLRAEAVRLLENATAHVLGDQRHRVVLLAGYIMNNQVRNLWPGDSQENREIAGYSAAAQGYIDQFELGERSLAELFSAIDVYTLHSAKARHVQTQLRARFHQPGLDPGTLPRALRAILVHLEVDLPQTRVLHPTERAIHARLFDFQYMNAAPPDGKELDRILRYFLTGHFA
jgi:hypothetical protein